MVEFEDRTRLYIDVTVLGELELSITGGADLDSKE